MTSDASNKRLDVVAATTERTAGNIEALTHQVGMLTEGMTDMRLGLSELQQTKKHQEQNIDRLVGLLETLPLSQTR
jgi:prefoldin subunit 5